MAEMSDAHKSLKGLYRADGFFQPFSGLGSIAKDPTQTIEWDEPPILDLYTLGSVYRSSAVCARIVDSVPKVALSKGLVAGDPTAKIPLAMLLPKLKRGLSMGRLFGGAVVVIGTNDGGSIAEPPAPGPKKVLWIRVFDRTEITVGPNEDPEFAERYEIRPARGAPFTVHRSRVLYCKGATTTNRQQQAENGGWHSSVLERPWRSIQLWEIAFSALANMLTGAETGVLKIHGLIQGLGQNRKEIEERAEIFQMGRSVCRALLLDAKYGEDYQKHSTNFTGVPDTIDRFAGKLSLDADIPLQILFGESPAGLNANGDPTVQAWRGDVIAWRGEEVDLQILKYLDLLGLGLDYEWRPLEDLSDAEETAAKKATAEIDQIYVQNQVFTADQVARARAGVGGWRNPIELDDLELEPDLGGAEELAEDADEPATSEPARVTLAAHMTEINAPACQHGRKQRCPACGVERESRAVAGPDGALVWGGPWRAL